MSSESDDRVDVEAPGEALGPAEAPETETFRTPSAAGLEALAREQGATITVVGCGGAGCNTVDRMAEAGLDAADLVAMNTDVQHLVGTRADGKVLLGRETVRGEGAGSLPHVGERAALDSAEEIDGVVRGSDMVFVTAGLGGGTGTGSAPLVARSATEAGALTVAIVTMPFTAEGEVRHANAVAGLERLRKVADTVIVIANDRLLDCVGEVPVERAFAVADEVLLHSVKGVTDLVTVPGMVNLDFADIETVMRSGGVALIGFGEDDGDDRAAGAVEAAVESPLVNVDMAGASAALVNVTGGPTMTIEEAEGVVEAIYDRVDPGARIIWGTTIDEDLEGTVRVMLILTGVESPQIYGRD